MVILSNEIKAERKLSPQKHNSVQQYCGVLHLRFLQRITTVLRPVTVIIIRKPLNDIGGSCIVILVSVHCHATDIPLPILLVFRHNILCLERHIYRGHPWYSQVIALYVLINSVEVGLPHTVFESELPARFLQYQRVRYRTKLRLLRLLLIS